MENFSDNPTGTILRSYRYRIYPNQTQRCWLNSMLVSGCRVHNAYMSELRKLFRFGLSVDVNEADDLLNYRKRLQLHIENLPISVYHAIRQQVDRRRKLYYSQNINGRPRTKTKTRYNALPFTTDGFALTGKKLNLERIGAVHIKLHRDIPATADILSCSVKRDKFDRWFAVFLLRIPKEVPSPIAARPSVGLDLGVLNFAVLSDGSHIDNPRFVDHYQQRLKELKKRRKCKCGTYRDWWDRRINRLGAHFSDCRRDFLHQQSARLVKTYSTICVEDLDMSQLLENAKSNKTLQKHVLDGRWDTFVKMLEYKAEGAGSQVIRVSPSGTSQICSCCGRWVQKTLRDRTHRCPYCGLELDRDLNAAINIQRFGTKQSRGDPSVSAVHVT